MKTAIGEINNLKQEAIASDAGDIQNYLIEVELTNDNIKDYFDYDLIVFRDIYGDVTSENNTILYSKKYQEEGWVIYDMEEARIDMPYGDPELESALHNSIQYNAPGLFPVFPERATGKLVFVKSDYILSYDIPETKDESVDVTITLKNGEVLTRRILVGYPY